MEITGYFLSLFDKAKGKCKYAQVLMSSTRWRVNTTSPATRIDSVDIKVNCLLCGAVELLSALSLRSLLWSLLSQLDWATDILLCRAC